MPGSYGLHPEVNRGSKACPAMRTDPARRRIGGCDELRYQTDCKVFPANQTLVDAATQDGLEQTPQQIAIAEATMPVLREG